MAEYREAKASEKPRESYDSGPIEMHIAKKYGKFHGHMKMNDGAEHHIAPMASMHEAHAALGEHLAEAAAETPASEEAEA